MNKQDTELSEQKTLSFGLGTILFIRVSFVVASLQFLKEAINKYDGFSAYISFMDFMPSVSVVFVINSVIIVSLAFVLYSGIYVLYRISSRLFISLRFEHFITWLILYFSLLIILRNFPLAEQLGMSHVSFLILVIPVTVIVIWLLRKHNEKLLNVIDFHITPLVWLFVFLSVVAAVIISLSVVFKSTDALNGGIQEQVTTGNINRPNIVLVSMDSLTALDMQLYGYRRPTTPFISEWSKDAFVFNKYYAVTNWTTPATMSMMTGHRPWTHKVWYRAFFNPVSKYEKNLPSVLKNNGYGVYNYIQNPYANPHTLGMEDYYDVKNRAYSFGLQEDVWYELFENMPVVGDWVSSLPVINIVTALSFPTVTTTLTPPELIYNRFLDYIGEREQSGNNKQPFFAWLHVLPPHKYYLPPAPFMGLFGDADRFNENTDQLIGHEYPPEMQADIDILRKRYDEFILYGDKQFEIFMQKLSKKIDMTNTIVVLSSDHGESFSHGYFEHAGQHLYEPLVHVPLVIKMPDSKAGKRIDVPVEQIDLAPTILELAGIDIPGWMEGRSLLPLTDGRTFENRPVFSMQLNENPSFGQPIQKGTFAIWEEDYKLIYYLGKKEVLLFNLKDDPGELTNLKDEKPHLTQRLLDEIKKNISQANKRITQSNN